MQVLREDGGGLRKPCCFTSRCSSAITSFLRGWWPCRLTFTGRTNKQKGSSAELTLQCTAQGERCGHGQPLTPWGCGPFQSSWDEVVLRCMRAHHSHHCIRLALFTDTVEKPAMHNNNGHVQQRCSNTATTSHQRQVRLWGCESLCRLRTSPAPLALHPYA